MNYGLHLSGVQIERVEADTQHPNRMKFRGVLVRLDEPSTKAPNGAAGHKILVSTEVAKRRLKTLIGMGLNYAPDLDGHAQRRKVGVIDKAWIDGKDLKVEGHVWKHDFPEAEKDLKQSGLGMSMELGDVRVDNPHADVWKLDDFQFLGATILWRDSAAYYRTQAIAARAEQRRGSMSKSAKTKVAAHASTSSAKRLAQIAAEAAAGAVRQGTRELLASFKEQTEVLAGIAASQEELADRVSALESGSTHTIAAEDGDDEDEIDATASSQEQVDAAGDEVDDEEMETRKVKAKGKKADDGASSSSASSSSQEEEEMESAMDEGDLEEEETDIGNKAGHINEDAKNHGSDTTGNKTVGKTVESAKVRALRSSNRKLREQLTQVQADSNTRIGKLETRLEKMSKQVEAAAKQTSRRSVSPEIAGLLAKGNVDPSDLFRTNTKLTVAEVDGILASSGANLSVQDRASIKSAMYREGLMEEGRVSRNAR